MRSLTMSYSLFAAAALFVSLSSVAASNEEVTNQNQSVAVSGAKNMEGKVELNDLNRDKDVTLPSTTRIEHTSEAADVESLASGDNGITALGPVMECDLAGSGC